MKYNVYILVKHGMYLAEFRIVTGPGLPYFFDFFEGRETAYVSSILFYILLLLFPQDAASFF